MPLSVSTAHGTVVPFGLGDGRSVVTAAGLILPVDDSTSVDDSTKVDDSTSVIRPPGRTYDK